MSKAPLLEMRGISKKFPGVIALDGVSLEVGRGEVVALCGENGAGKSTLMKILGGVYQPDGGEILHGRLARQNQQRHRRDEIRHRVHPSGIERPRQPRRGRECFSRPRTCSARFISSTAKKFTPTPSRYLNRLGLNISSRTPLDRLSIAQQQMVEIAKALSLNARPHHHGRADLAASRLTETERLLELVFELSEQGVSIIYISHRLGEIEHCADRVVVLRDGKNAGELPRPTRSTTKL